MAGMPQPKAAHTPAANHLAKDTTLVQVALAGSKWKLINRVRREIVANIEDAGAFVAGQAIYVLGSIRLAAANGTIVDSVRPRIPCLKRQAGGKAALQTEHKRMVGTGADIGLVVHRTVRVPVGKVLIKDTRASQAAIRGKSRLGLAEVHPSARKQAHTA